MRERFLHQLEAEPEIRTARPAERIEHLRVVGGIDDDEHVAEVLGRGADEARAADVDLLHQGVEGRVGILRRRGERIQVDDHEIDRGDAVAGDGRQVIRPGPPGQDAGVDGWMQGLDPPVHHLGKPGDIGDAHDRQPGGRERRGGAPGRHQLDAEIGETAAQLSEPGLVRNTQNCTHIGRFT